MYNVGYQGFGESAPQMSCGQGTLIARGTIGFGTAVEYRCVRKNDVKLQMMNGGMQIEVWGEGSDMPSGGAWWKGFIPMNLFGASPKATRSVGTPVAPSTVPLTPGGTNVGPAIGPISIGPSSPRQARVGTQEFTVYVGASTPSAIAQPPCPAGYTPGELYGGAGWYPTCIKTSLVPPEALAIKTLSTELPATTDAKKGMPTWGWVALGLGGVVTVGAVVAGIVFASRRR